MRHVDGPARKSRRGVGRPTSEADNVDEFSAALAALNSFQQMTQQADAKAGMFVAVYISLLAVFSARLEELDSSGVGAGLSVSLWVVGTAFVASLIVTGYGLVAAIRPRTAAFTGPNRFSVAQVAAGGRAADGGDPVAAGWRAAQAVAEIALAKNLLVTRSILGVSASGCFLITWLGLLTLI